MNTAPGTGRKRRSSPNHHRSRTTAQNVAAGGDLHHLPRGSLSTSSASDHNGSPFSPHGRVPRENLGNSQRHITMTQSRETDSPTT